METLSYNKILQDFKRGFIYMLGQNKEGRIYASPKNGIQSDIYFLLSLRPYLKINVGKNKDDVLAEILHIWTSNKEFQNGLHKDIYKHELTAEGQDRLDKCIVDIKNIASCIFKEPYDFFIRHKEKLKTHKLKIRQLNYNNLQLSLTHQGVIQDKFIFSHENFAITVLVANFCQYVLKEIQDEYLKSLCKPQNENDKYTMVNRNLPVSLFAKKDGLLKNPNYSMIERQVVQIKWEPLHFTLRELEVVSAISNLVYKNKAKRLGRSSYLALPSKSELYEQILDKTTWENGRVEFNTAEAQRIDETLKSLMAKQYNFVYFKDNRYIRGYGNIVEKIVEKRDKVTVKELPEIKETDFVLQVNHFFFFDNPKYKKIPKIKYLKKEIKEKCEFISRINDTHVFFILFLIFQSNENNLKITRKLEQLVEALKTPSLKNKLLTGHKKFVIDYLENTLFKMALAMGYLSRYKIYDKDNETYFDIYINQDKVKEIYAKQDIKEIQAKDKELKKD